MIMELYEDENLFVFVLFIEIIEAFLQPVYYEG
jgi:hypothetical protein